MNNIHITKLSRKHGKLLKLSRQQIKIINVKSGLKIGLISHFNWTKFPFLAKKSTSPSLKYNLSFLIIVKHDQCTRPVGQAY